MKSAYLRPPDGAYRKRLCLPCRDRLEAEGYFMNVEEDSVARGVCELCRRSVGVSAVWRYTLSTAERKKRGLWK